MGEGDQERTVNILSANASNNPHPGSTFINVDGTTFQIEDKHVTVFFPENFQQSTMAGGTITFAKPSSDRRGRNWSRITRILIVTGVVSAIGGLTAAWWLRQ
jgi:hypothetical protein